MELIHSVENTTFKRCVIEGIYDKKNNGEFYPLVGIMIVLSLTNKEKQTSNVWI